MLMDEKMNNLLAILVGTALVAGLCGAVSVHVLKSSYLRRNMNQFFHFS